MSVVLGRLASQIRQERSSALVAPESLVQLPQDRDTVDLQHAPHCPTPFGGSGMTCSRCQQDNPVADAQYCPRCGAPIVPPNESDSPAASYVRGCRLVPRTPSAASCKPWRRALSVAKRNAPHARSRERRTVWLLSRASCGPLHPFVDVTIGNQLSS